MNLAVPLINCEINLIIIWSANCVITESTSAETFAMQKLYDTVVTLLIQDNTKVL